MRISRKACFLLSCLVLLTACQSSSVSEQSRFEITNTHSQDNRIAVVETTAYTRFDVYSDFGIGSSDIRLLAGEWPDDVRLRLYLAGLEGLSLSSHGMTWDESHLPITRSNDERFYQVQLPAKKLGDVLRIQWVDFYR